MDSSRLAGYRIRPKRLADQSGQAVIEHIIIWPVLAFVVLSAIQLGLLYRDKATLNDAAFRAAREGALNHAFVDPMRKTLVESLVPLYMSGEASATSYATATVRAYAENLVNPSSGRALSNLSGVDVEIISPSRNAFQRMSRNMYSLEDECRDPQQNRRGNDRSRCREERYRQIPNDNLNIRSLATQRVTVEGQAVDMNVQDANLLKVRVHYCAELVVPLTARIGFSIAGILFGDNSFWDFYGRNGGSAHSHWDNCRNRTMLTIVTSAAGVSIPRRYFIPISSTAIVRMQSPIRCEGDERNGSRCRNLR